VTEWEPENKYEENLDLPVIADVYYAGKKIESLSLWEDGKLLNLELNKPEANV
jgi:hypothetical protein